MESLTYRFEGHSMGDPERYRSKDEVHQYREDDPIGIFGKRLIQDYETTQETLDELDLKAKKEIEAAVEFAQNSPDPTPDDLYADIYA
jgi:pyruvate dehydrogenase E1 component alpha subunit